MRLVAFFREVVGFLRHEARRVRLAGARALSDFGPTAKRYAQAVRDAAAAESDDVVRRTMEGLLRTIEK